MFKDPATVLYQLEHCILFYILQKTFAQADES